MEIFLIVYLLVGFILGVVIAIMINVSKGSYSSAISDRNRLPITILIPIVMTLSWPYYVIRGFESE